MTFQIDFILGDDRIHYRTNATEMSLDLETGGSAGVRSFQSFSNTSFEFENDLAKWNRVFV